MVVVVVDVGIDSRGVHINDRMMNWVVALNGVWMVLLYVVMATILLDNVINVAIAVISWVHDFIISLLHFAGLTLMLQDTTTLFTSKLLLFLLPLPFVSLSH